MGNAGRNENYSAGRMEGSTEGRYSAGGGSRFSVDLVDAHQGVGQKAGEPGEGSEEEANQGGGKEREAGDAPEKGLPFATAYHVPVVCKEVKWNTHTVVVKIGSTRHPRNYFFDSHTTFYSFHQCVCLCYSSDACTLPAPLPFSC